ncbi:MAG: beta-ketoacyl-ACP synthase II [Nitrospirota bacterium]|jgi:3-oxoacyl-[acyl-carrier-protein] synthase II
MTEPRRVVVTGLGVVSPLAVGTRETWEAMRAGKSGIGPITQFDATDFATRIAGEVKGFDPERYIEPKEVKKMDRFMHMAVAASTMAMEDAGLAVTPENAERVGVIIGSGMGGLPAIERYHKVVLERGPRRLTPFFIPMVIINLAAGHVSMLFGAKGPNSAAATACATGSHSIGDSFRLIQRGYADAMISGGAESCITPLGIGGFNAMKALSTRNDEPERASRPFDRDRDGFVMGEGAGIVVLEEMHGALRRGARIHAEVVGYGMTGDAYHMTAPAPEGEGAARCMALTLKDSGLSPGEVDYINAHGTSTKQGDEIETTAVKTVFGQHAYKLVMGSTKSMTGHLLGAAGGVEAVATVMSIVDGVIPPTINLENPDPECDLDYAAGKARERAVRCAMSNSFGFGGTNACLLFKQFEK